MAFDLWLPPSSDPFLAFVFIPAMMGILFWPLAHTLAIGIRMTALGVVSGVAVLLFSYILPVEPFRIGHALYGVGLAYVVCAFLLPSRHERRIGASIQWILVGGYLFLYMVGTLVLYPLPLQ
jgi:hypothetical protein